MTFAFLQAVGLFLLGRLLSWPLFEVWAILFLAFLNFCIWEMQNADRQGL